MRFSNLTLKIW